jgi:hypothetical protein
MKLLFMCYAMVIIKNETYTHVFSYDKFIYDDKIDFDKNFTQYKDLSQINDYILSLVLIPYFCA